MRAEVRIASKSERCSSELDTVARAEQIALRTYSHRDWTCIAPLWTQLALVSRFSSFYVSVEWVSAWLQVFGDVIRPQILIFENCGQPIGACLLSTAMETRGPFRVRRLYLNTGGESLSERSLVEYNTILCLPGWEREVACELAAHIQHLSWDELAFEGLCPSPVASAIEFELSPLRASCSTLQSYYVDLVPLRTTGVPYLKTLSGNSRSQIVRSMKGYEEMGPLQCEIAEDLGAATAFFAELRELHQSRWTARGEIGAFAPERKFEFHNALIRRGWPSGTVHLLRVRAGTETIGVLYNFVQGRKIYFFQSGFRYVQARHLKPGLVTHACAIQRYTDLGFDEYDLMVGEARYKKQLANNSRPLHWVMYQHPGVKMTAINALRTLKRSIRQLGRDSGGASKS